MRPSVDFLGLVIHPCQPPKPRKEGGEMSKQPEAPDELDQIFYQALRGKTVTPEQAHILEWAEARLKPALLAREDLLVREAIIDELDSAIKMKGKILAGGRIIEFGDQESVSVGILEARRDAIKAKLASPNPGEKQ